MEIKAEDLKDFIGIPVCWVHKRMGYKKAKEEWLIIRSVRDNQESVEVVFTDGGNLEFGIKDKHTELFLSV